MYENKKQKERKREWKNKKSRPVLFEIKKKKKEEKKERKKQIQNTVLQR